MGSHLLWLLRYSMRLSSKARLGGLTIAHCSLPIRCGRRYQHLRSKTAIELRLSNGKSEPCSGPLGQRPSARDWRAAKGRPALRGGIYQLIANRQSAIGNRQLAIGIGTWQLAIGT